MTKNTDCTYEEATPEAIEKWRNEDYWMRMDYDPLVMFVVIPTIIQLLAFLLMGGVMLMNSYFFG